MATIPASHSLCCSPLVGQLNAFTTFDAPNVDTDVPLRRAVDHRPGLDHLHNAYERG